MAHKPQHPNNPCRLPDGEQTPAKIWELLRRNDKFRRTVARLEALDRRAKAERTSGRAWRASQRMIHSVGKRHAFAAVALQWLVPEPVFRVHQVALSKGITLAGNARVEVEIIKVGIGTSPNPGDEANWQWRAPEQFDDTLLHSRRGPLVFWQTSADPLLSSKVNEIEAWRDFFARSKFSLNTSWSATPPGFKRTLQHLWRKFDTRAVNSETQTRHDAPERHETDFFQGWHPAQILSAGSVSTVALARLRAFEKLSQDYRVFAFPTSIRTRMEARHMANWLVEQLVQLPDGSRLPQREKELLGTPLEWDILLAYEDRRRRGDEHTPALQHTFDTLHAHQPTARRLATKPTERSLDAALRHIVAKKLLSTAESARWHSWQDDFARIHSPLAGTGLIQSIFPRLASVLPPAPAPAAP